MSAYEEQGISFPTKKLYLSGYFSCKVIDHLIVLRHFLYECEYESINTIFP